MYHVKFKSKISYLGEKISILPWQMAEQLAVEVNVKNVTYGWKTDRHTDKLLYLVRIRSSGPYGPFLLAPVEGIGGPFGPLLGALWAPISSQNTIKKLPT